MNAVHFTAVFLFILRFAVVVWLVGSSAVGSECTRRNADYIFEEARKCQNIGNADGNGDLGNGGIRPLEHLDSSCDSEAV